MPTRPRLFWIFLGLSACSTKGGKSSPTPGTPSSEDTSAEDAWGDSGTTDPPGPGELAWADTDHDLGTAPIDCTVSEARVLTNTGASNLTVDAVTIAGAGFSVDAEVALPVTLAPADTLTLWVSASVSDPGDTSGLLTVDWDGGSTLSADQTLAVDASAVCVQLDGGSVERTDTWSTAVQSADILMVLDTSCSMSSILSTVSQSFPTLAAELSATMPDASFGIASFEDYPYSRGDVETGEGNDRPFHLALDQTLDLASVDAALAGIELRNGADWPEAHLEAMVQTLTGRGFDQGCDGYSPTTDVLPYVASATDPFGGAAGQLDTGAGLGTLGGTGRRADTVPIVFLVTDAFWRDPELGYLVPPGCFDPAGGSEAEAVFASEGAYLSGLLVDDGTGELAEAFSGLAAATDSLHDSDADGTPQPARVYWEREADQGAAIAEQIAALVAERSIADVAVQTHVPEDSGLTASATVDATGVTTTGESVEVSVSITGSPTAATPVEVHLVATLEGHTRILARRTYLVEAPSP